ncbi:uncharacterized protein L3040_007032 [Drepanopeziza brunnea f. sp. 'multigermtubi']|uniref:Kinetochore protein n=1 Tax=Marssonina brunnea f. sp. multigermtubi (strain MB_m1) TaxID=1072389 RepID=K1W745_MARBU|nr:kinetochore protein [Drepanopeziza brunnea f. sp. 'multigermtubi' MB_m1]EKD12875.1 kinetochore protein [Drepanopeziza brunnea f. sp. 'multigermtubi' MB_m1]KAJ5038163.1 hypothetical protein L3040_007032 [Drepanopeziza brunnea f. sp. 'multigermtubi']
MVGSTPTIIDLKTAFLRSQIILLSQPLRPSPTFTASNSSAEENALRQKAIDDALLKLNHQLKQHNKLAYGPQAQRHVAEQVDMLYWNAGERGVKVGEDWAERGADYREESVIEQLPEAWGEEASTKAPEQAAKYAELQQRLTALNEQRRVARERVERYRRMRDLVGLLGEDAGVQENLVTRNGAVEVELEKMRRLMLRVERGVGALEERGEGAEMDLDGEDEEGKILALLGG